MKKDNTFIKIVKTLLAFGVILWLGGSIIRTVIAYDIYVPATELQLKENYSNEIRMHTVKLFAIGSLYTESGFALAFICYVIIAAYYRKELKSNGWLFMSVAIFFLASPACFYLSYLDIQLNLNLMSGYPYVFGDTQIQDFFEARFRKLNFLPPLTYMAVFTSLIFVIFKPLQKLS